MSQNLAKYVSISEIEQEALQLLPRSVRGYFQSGADDEQTLSRNIQAFKRLLIRPLALRDVNKLDTSVEIKLKDKNGNVCFNERFPYPLAIAPTAFQKMAHPDGEEATARVASETRTLMVNSTISTTRLEDVSKAAGSDGLLFFQLYVYKDRKLTESLVRRAESAGFRALVLTVDAPLFGKRRADEKNGFELPSHLTMANFTTTKFAQTSSGKVGTSGLANYTKSLFDASLNWSDLKWLVNFSTLPVIVKGIMRPEDAITAIENGASAVWISNHGGRQLDSAPATIEALPEVVRAVQGRVPVFVDGGVRSGTDIFKSVALGADLVFVGRPIIWGLTVGAEQGVKRVLELLHDEFEYAMKLSGCPLISDVRKNMVVHETYYSKL
ncbi:Hydroxyacid oxidase 1 [Aphelenchoides bicaudatus]|nr:Hydroxyacid oxidase 1 [Aphelenchoides bicaudatus]